MTKPTKRTVTVSNKPSAKTLKTLAESYYYAGFILASVEGVPDTATAMHTQAIAMLATTFNEIKTRYEAQSKKPLDLSHIPDALQVTETKDDQDTTTQA